MMFLLSFNACDSAGERLGVSFGDLLNIPTILDEACDVVCGSGLDDFKAVSILATILGVGIRRGVGAKLSRFDRTDFC